MQSRRPVTETAEAAPAPTPAATLVVAAVPLRFGTELTARGLREIPWPGDHMPAGAFRSIAEMLGKGRRVALAAMEPNEPVLAGKITGAGQRGTLSTVLDDAMGAVTVPVNEVVGVGGFVLPGVRVDEFLTRQPRGGHPERQARRVPGSGCGRGGAASDARAGPAATACAAPGRRGAVT